LYTDSNKKGDADLNSEDRQVDALDKPKDQTINDTGKTEEGIHIIFNYEIIYYD